MKIAIGQINNTVGDFYGNVEMIKNQAIEATAHGAVAIVFPELAVCGYPVRDLVELTEFHRANDEAIENLRAFSSRMSILIIVGGLGTTQRGRVSNSAYAIHEGKIIHQYDKMLLPTYDVFDEWRNFAAGDERRAKGFKFMGRKIALCICEDMWNNETFKRRHGIIDKYDVDPVDLLVDEGCDLIINLSASPFNRHKLEVRRDLLVTVATEHGVDVIYCNMVGGNDSLVFDGNSMAVTKDGGFIMNAPSFQSKLAYVNFETGEGTFEFQLTDEMVQTWTALVLGVQDYTRKCGFTEAVIGLSGGIDSAVVAAIAVEALGSDHVTCITMPSGYSSEGSVADSVAFANNHGIKLLQVTIEDIKTQFVLQMQRATLPTQDNQPESIPISSLADENLQARIRGTILMTYSNSTRALVLTTGNKSETAVGYCTLYGDMVGGLAVIADVLKTKVYALAHWYNNRAEVIAAATSSVVLSDLYRSRKIPESTLTKAPSAELAPGQYDQQSLPPYEVLDPIIEGYVEDRKSEEEISKGLPVADRATIHRVLGLIDRAEYKRQQAAPTIKVTSKAWFGRFMPIAKKSLYR